MLARATKAIQEHVKDMTEKTKTTCCVSSKHPEKENMLINNNYNNHHRHPLDPIYIYDKITDTTYLRGKLLGKGGFAKCYELTCVKTGKSYAGKIISKNRISKPHQKEKIEREVELHKNLWNPHVVSFHSYFEDDDNVYIVLENCSRKSLVHVLRSRKTLTEPEVRYYLRQLVDGCKYIHSQRIIHRDLKLGNMLLNENMHVKIADFGLATRVQYEGEQKMTVCGTPNYIAPEVLQKKGHSYEADIWAIGCVMYALLVGRPPFETSTLKETYQRITTNKFRVPSHISPPAQALIHKLLAADPKERPSLDKILEDDFFKLGIMPKQLSTSCCETAPTFSMSHHIRPKSYAAPVTAHEAMQKITSSIAQIKPPKRSTTPSPARSVHSAHSAPSSVAISSVRSRSTDRLEEVATPTPRADLSSKSAGSTGSRSSRRRTSTTEIKTEPELAVAPAVEAVLSAGVEEIVAHEVADIAATEPQPDSTALPLGSSLRMYQMLTTCLDQMPADSNPSPVLNVKPLWVTKWVDYSNKYGFGFQMSDRSVGVLFNDTTRMLLSPGGKTIQYNDLSNKVYTFSTDNSPREYRKKATLLLYFAQYMDEHLIHGGDVFRSTEDQNDIPSPVFMKKWFRPEKAIVMYLSNGTLQVNFFEDHTKVILSPDNQDYLVTYINSSRQAVTYRLLQLRHFGCHPQINERLTYARTMLESIMNIDGEAV